MQPETFYHVYNHANGFENLFQNKENYRYFLQQWGKYISPVADTYTYCLMPNHIHFLIRTGNEKEILNLQGFKNLGGFDRYEKIIIQQFSNLFNSYTKAFNKMYERKGSLFRPNFKKKEINSESYLANVISYIHYNPVHHACLPARHGFTNSLLDWPYSSIHAILAQKNTRIKRNEVINWFGRSQQLKEFHHQAIKDLDKMEMEFT